MADRKELVRKALAEKTLLKLMHEQHDRTRAELAEHFTDPGEREVGMLLDHRLGTVGLQDGREFWAVVDEEAFLNWVCVTNRDETVLSVRPAFTAAVLAKCKRDGGYLDWETGTVDVPPGVALRKASPTLVERPDKHAGFVVREWLGGDVAEQLGIEAS